MARTSPSANRESGNTRMEGERDVHDASTVRSPHAFADPLSSGQMGEEYASSPRRTVKLMRVQPRYAIHCDFQRSNFSLTVVAVPLH